MNKIKVLHVELTSSLGGIESLLMNVYDAIDKDKYQFDFLASGKGNYQDDLINKGAHIYVMPDFKNLMAYRRKFLNVLNNNYDIIHFHKNSAANIIPIYLAKHHISHPKIIVHSHNSAPSHNNIFTSSMHKLNRKYINKIADEKVACSELAGKWMYGKKSKFTIINNGIDTDRFTFSSAERKSIRDKYNIRNNTLVFGNVSRLSKQKNHEYLLKTFSEINKINTNTLLMIIGDGTLERNIRTKIISMGLQDKVLMLGTQENIPPYLSAMDAYMAPSLYEGLGISAVEAQSEGLPTFVSEAFPDEVKISKYLSKFSLTKSPKALAKEMLKFNYKDNSFKNRIRQAKLIGKSEFSIKRTVSEFEALYRK